MRTGLGIKALVSGLLWAAITALAPASAAPAKVTSSKGPATLQLQYRDNIKHFGSDEGLPQNGVGALAEDRDGYLWLATYGGLARFDGLNFKVFRSLARSGPSSDRIQSLALDAQGRVWLGTEDAGVSVRQPNGVFNRLGGCGARCEVSALFVQADHVVAITDQGLWRIEPRTLSMQRIGSLQPLPGAVQDRQGVIYLRDASGVHAYDGKTLRALPWPAALAQAQADTRLLSLDGQPLVQTEGGWQTWNGQEWTDKPLVAIKTPVRSVHRDPTGRLWINTTDEHVHVQDPGTPMREVMNTEIASSLSDSEGNFWFGSNRDGLFRVTRARVGLLQDPALGFDQPASAVARAQDNSLWLGLNCGGIRRIRVDGRIDTFSTQASMGSECIWSLRPDPQGKLWVGTRLGVLARFDPASGRFTRVYASKDPAIIRGMLIDQGNLWVAIGQRVYTAALDARGDATALTPVPAFDGMTTYRIQTSKKGGLWFVGDQGVRRYVKGKIVEQWTTKEGLSTRFVRSLFEEPDGRLWIGTYGGGLNLVQDGKVKVYGVEAGLQDDVVSCIVEGKQGRLWLAANRGVSVVSKEARMSTRTRDGLDAALYAKEDGLDPAETNGGVDPACMEDANGLIWFPLMRGFGVIDPGMTGVSKQSPPVVSIESIRIAGRLQPETASLNLPVAAKDVEITFSAPALTSPGKLRFRYRLSKDEAWVDTGNRRSVNFPAMPYGTYTLEVQARSGDGAWSAPALLRIEHPRPWYLQPVWLILATLAVAGLTLLLRGLLARYLRRGTERVARPLRQRANELEDRNRRLDEQVHRDGLTGLYNRRHLDAVLAAAVDDDAQRPLSVLMVDVDEFKKYNDHFGHLEGDACLQAVAEAMQAQVRANDVLARYGGEEFALVLPARNAVFARTMAERFINAVLERQLAQAPGTRYPVVTLSIGFATLLANDPATAADLVERADQALYRAKAEGRNQVQAG